MIMMIIIILFIFIISFFNAKIKNAIILFVNLLSISLASFIFFLYYI